MTALDEVTPEEAPRAFFRKPTWQRVVVLSAGSITHFVIGMVLVYALAVARGPAQPAQHARRRRAELRGEPGVADRAGPCAPGVPEPAARGRAAVRRPDRLGRRHARPRPGPTPSLAIRAAGGPTPVVVERGGQELGLTVDVARVQRLDRGRRPGHRRRDRRRPADGVRVRPAHGRARRRWTSPARCSSNVWQGILSFPERIPALWEALGGGERDENTPVSVVGASIIGGDAAERGPLGVLRPAAGPAELLRRRVQPAAAAAAGRRAHRRQPLRAGARRRSGRGWASPRCHRWTTPGCCR